MLGYLCVEQQSQGNLSCAAFDNSTLRVLHPHLAAIQVSDKMVLDGSKVAVVVEASRGIGFELAKLLAEQGHEVFATCRTRNDAIDSISAHYTNLQAVLGASSCPDCLQLSPAHKKPLVHDIPSTATPSVIISFQGCHINNRCACVHMRVD